MVNKTDPRWIDPKLFKKFEPIVSNKEEFFIENTKKGDNDSVKDAWDQFIMLATLAYGDKWQNEVEESKLELMRIANGNK